MINMGEKTYFEQLLEYNTEDLQENIIFPQER